MEEDKKIIGSESTNIQGEDNIISLPGLSVQYDKGQIEQGERKLPARISNFLSESITATIHSIETKYKLTIKDSDVKKAVDENGKLSKLSAMQKKTLLALQSQLSLLLDKPSIREYTEKIKNGENPESVEEFISLEELCRDICGEEERWKSRRQQEIKEELKKLSNIKQLQIYHVDVADDNGNKRPGIVKIYEPYITLVGEEREIRIGKRTAKAVKIRFARIFLEDIGDRYFTILPSFWKAKKSNGKRISTDHFYSLASLAFDFSWSHYLYNLPRGKQRIKKDDILDTERQAQIIKTALTHEPIHFDRIKDILKVKTEARAEKIRFKNYLWEAMWALIDYGLLTSDSTIDWEKETITLVYNQDYATPRQKQIPPSGEWSRNPFEKKKPGK